MTQEPIKAAQVGDMDEQQQLILFLSDEKKRLEEELSIAQNNELMLWRIVGPPILQKIEN